jgi:hypothetical protein
MRTSAWILSLALVGSMVGGLSVRAQDKPKDQDKDRAQAAAADPVTGDWEGLVDLPDGAMSFSMTLKLDRDKVSGEVAGPQGASTISDGTWAEKDAKLTISFTYTDGAPVTMTGTVTEDQITGSLSYGGGDMVINWVAKRKVAK